MNRLGRAVLMLTLGAVGTRLVLTGEFGAFLQQRMRWPLLLASVVLIGFGLFEMAGVWRPIDDHDQDHGAHDPADEKHASRGPIVGWMLLLPVIALVSIAPSALGASASDRLTPITPNRVRTEFVPLERADGPVEMRVWDFLERAIWDEEQSLSGVRVRLEGIVVNDPLLFDGFMLTRFVVSCCAADGIPIQIALHDAPQFEDDTWVQVDAIWREPSTPYGETSDRIVVEATAVSVRVMSDPPNDPYETPY